MSKRITLTDFETTQIIKALESLRDETNLSYQVVAVGKRFYGQLITKLKSQHPRSVETLGVSGAGDTTNSTTNAQSR